MTPTKQTVDRPDRHEFVVIAHRGASGYLPEHTLEGVAMAHAMGSEYIEQDVVLTKDNELIVLHDLYLDAVTDVAERFPGRQNADGHYYAIDFSLAEIGKLRVRERRQANGLPVFPDRFPASEAIFRIPTLEQEIQLIQGLNRSTGRDVGLYIEPKSPGWHTNKGRDIVRQIIDVLAKYGYRDSSDNVYLQSFDAGSLQHAKVELGTRLKLVQLIGENDWREAETDYDYLRSPEGLADIATYADGIGPWLPQVVEIGAGGVPSVTKLVADAHAVGLFVHAYTLRIDQLPEELNDFDTVIRLLVEQARLDGVFTDFPDRVAAALRQLE